MKRLLRWLFWNEISDTEFLCRMPPRFSGIVTHHWAKASMIWAAFPVFLFLRMWCRFWPWLRFSVSRHERELIEANRQGWSDGHMKGVLDGERRLYDRMDKQLEALEQKNRAREARTYENKGKAETEKPC